LTIHEHLKQFSIAKGPAAKDIAGQKDGQILSATCLASACSAIQQAWSNKPARRSLYAFSLRHAPLDASTTRSRVRNGPVR
jgi:hypothetical protein